MMCLSFPNSHSTQLHSYAVSSSKLSLFAMQSAVIAIRSACLSVRTSVMHWHVPNDTRCQTCFLVVNFTVKCQLLKGTSGAGVPKESGTGNRSMCNFQPITRPISKAVPFPLQCTTVSGMRTWPIDGR